MFLHALEDYLAVGHALEARFFPGLAALRDSAVSERLEARLRAGSAAGGGGGADDKARAELRALCSATWGTSAAGFTQVSLSLRYAVSLHVDACCLGELMFFGAGNPRAAVRHNYFYMAGVLVSLGERYARVGSLVLVPARVLHGTLASCAANGHADLLGSALTTKVKVHAVAPTSTQLRELRGAAARAQEAKARLNTAAAEVGMVPD
jgi:hypothetical protein